MRRMGLTAAALLAACVPTTESKPAPVAPPSAQPSRAVAAPVEDAVEIRITAERDGQVVQVPVGRRFAVALVGIPTAGYVWRPVAPPAFLTAAGEGSGPTTEAQRQPGFTGGNHWEVFYFTASAAGRGELRFEQRRPWEANEPPAGTFKVTIEAQ